MNSKGEDELNSRRDLLEGPEGLLKPVVLVLPSKHAAESKGWIAGRLGMAGREKAREGREQSQRAEKLGGGCRSGCLEASESRHTKEPNSSRWRAVVGYGVILSVTLAEDFLVTSLTSALCFLCWEATLWGGGGGPRRHCTRPADVWVSK